MTPEAPADMIAARGALENYLFVVPSLDLVVARTARLVGEGRRPERFDGPIWSLLTDVGSTELRRAQSSAHQVT